jgi:hypothetical protein
MHSVNPTHYRRAVPSGVVSLSAPPGLDPVALSRDTPPPRSPSKPSICHHVKQINPHCPIRPRHWGSPHLLSAG